MPPSRPRSWGLPRDDGGGRWQPGGGRVPTATGRHRPGGGVVVAHGLRPCASQRDGCVKGARKAACSERPRRRVATERQNVNGLPGLRQPGPPRRPSAPHFVRTGPAQREVWRGPSPTERGISRPRATLRAGGSGRPRSVARRGRSSRPPVGGNAGVPAASGRGCGRRRAGGLGGVGPRVRAASGRGCSRGRSWRPPTGQRLPR
jgi:hypothetical protein